MRLSHVFALLAGGAVVALAVLATRGEAPQPRTAVAHRPASAPGFDRLHARLDRLEELLAAEPQSADLDARLDRLEAMVARIRPGAAAAAPPDDAESSRVRAKGLSTDLTKSAEAIAAWDAVARRTRDPKLKAEAWFEQGEIYRKLDDYAAAARVWQRVVDTVGLETSRGRTAAYQLAWAHARQQDHQTAYETFQRLAAVPNLPKAVESAVRLQVAVFAKATGDTDTARREFRRYVDDYSNDEAEHYRNLAKSAAQQLETLQ